MGNPMGPTFRVLPPGPLDSHRSFANALAIWGLGAESSQALALFETTLTARGEARKLQVLLEGYRYAGDTTVRKKCYWQIVSWIRSHGPQIEQALAAMRRRYVQRLSMFDDSTSLAERLLPIFAPQSREVSLSAGAPSRVPVSRHRLSAAKDGNGVVNGNGVEEAPPLKAPSDLEETKATPESFFNLLEGEFKRIRNRYLAIQENLPPEIREKYTQELAKLERRLAYWMESIISYLDVEPRQEKERFKEDILIGERILLHQILQLGAAIFSEPMDETSLTSVGLRNALGIPVREKPPIPEIETIPDAKGKLLPALINHDIGFGRTLALRPHQIIAINKLRGLVRLRKGGPAMNGAMEELLRGTVVMPVGGGKTRVMVASFALAIEEGLFSTDRGDKFIILNHTEQIHEQNKEVVELLAAYFQRQFGRKLKVTEYKAEAKDISGDVVVVSIPSINTEERRKQFEKALRQGLGQEGKIVMTAVDEIHHLELGRGKSKESWQEAVKVLRKVSPDLYRIGFTATPTGKEGPYIVRIRELDLMRAGVTPRTYLVRVAGEDLSKLKVSEQAADFQTRALVSVLLEFPQRNQRLYEALERHGIKREDRSPSGKERFEGVLGFAADVRHAQMMARDYREHFIPSPLVGEGGGEGLKGRTIKILGDDQGGISPRALDHVMKIYESKEVDALIAVVSQKTSPAVRQRILDLVAEGKIEAVFNVGIWMEGADLWMFTHLLGAKPTFSRYQKGQERGRLNRRGPNDVSSKGELLSDKPKILFDVIDQYHGDRSLIRYGDMMGVRGHTTVAYGELFDAMAEQTTSAVDKEGRAIEHRDLNTLIEKRGLVSRPKTDLTPLTTKLWEILGNQYQGDVEAMALDLGIPVEEMEQILQGQGWINQRWFLRRLATLLYQDREVLVEIYNAERGLADERVSDTDIQILRGALAVHYEWEGEKEGAITIEGDLGFGKERIELTANLFQELARGSLGDLQWRMLWRGMAVYFGIKGKEANGNQAKALRWRERLDRHLFAREKWPTEANTARERLLLEARKLTALKFGGRLPQQTGIAEVPVQNAQASLTRWLKGERIEFGKGVTSRDFYEQVRRLLIDLGLAKEKVDVLIVDAVFEQEGWNQDQSSAAKKLLYQARYLTALRFGGRLPRDTGIDGVPVQFAHSSLTRWLKGERIEFGRGASSREFYEQVRSLLIGLGLAKEKIEALILDAVFEQEGWDQDQSSGAKRLLYQARKLTALKFGERLPRDTGIAEVPVQFAHSPLTRWLAGKSVRLTPSLLSQIRALLLHGGANPPEEVEGWIETVKKQ